MDQRVIGRGELFFEPENTDRPGERYLGNTPSLTLSRKLTKVSETKSVRGVLVDKDSVVTKEDHSLSFDTDNLSDDNLTIWFGNQQSRPPQLLDFFNIPMTVYRGRHYQVGATRDNPIGFGSTDGLKVLINGEDAVGQYFVDNPNGRIYIPQDSTIGDGQQVEVTGLSVPQDSTSISTKPAEVIGKLRYVSHNPTSRQLSLVWPRVALTPSGDVDIKARAAWTTLSFSGSVRKLQGLPYVFGYSRGTPIGQIYPGGPDVFDFLKGEDRLDTLVNVTMPSRGYPV